MNTRQFELITILLTSTERYLLVDDLAAQVGCSEKTVRNDFKFISELFAKHSNIQLNRKPGRGIFLTGTVEERERLLTLLQRIQEKPDDERIFDLTYELLTAKQPLTLGHFADQYFTSRANITKDIESIANWLSPFNITLQSKQKVGIFLEGAETKKRSAIAYLASSQKFAQHSITQLFPEHDVNFIKSVIQRQNFSFTDDTSDRLVIHILIMIKRIKQNNPIKIPEKDKQTIEQIEYQQARQIAQEIEPYFALKIPISEVIYLAWHLISGKKLTVDKVDNPTLDKLVVELIAEMTQLTEMDFNTDMTLYQGLYTHLQPVLNRISYQLPIKNPLLTEIKNMYPYMFSMVISALAKSTELFSVILLEDEVAYIVLHFQASVERQKKIKNQKKRAIVVCHLGIGMSQLLTSRIERHMPDLQIVDCVGKADFDKYQTNDVDFIISTIELAETSAKHIVISPLFNFADQERLQVFIEESRMNGANAQDYTTLLHFIHNDSIFLQVDLEHRYQVVEMLANSLYEQGFVKKEFIHNAILRERTSATAIGSSIAIPHGEPTGILHSGIAVAALKQPMDWGNEKVSLVFLLAVADEKPQVTKKLFNELSFLSDQHALVRKLTKQQDANAFIQLLI